jgi:hypothetical protein
MNIAIIKTEKRNRIEKETGKTPATQIKVVAEGKSNASTAHVTAGKARIDRLKEQLRSTPAEVDHEWNVDWMKEEHTAEECKHPEDKKANASALKYREKRTLKPRTLEIFEKMYGFDPKPAFGAGFVVDFFSWPGGGGNPYVSAGIRLGKDNP